MPKCSEGIQTGAGTRGRSVKVSTRCGSIWAGSPGRRAGWDLADHLFHCPVAHLISTGTRKIRGREIGISRSDRPTKSLSYGQGKLPSPGDAWHQSISSRKPVNPSATSPCSLRWWCIWQRSSVRRLHRCNRLTRAWSTRRLVIVSISSRRRPTTCGSGTMTVGIVRVGSSGTARLYCPCWRSYCARSGLRPGC